LLRLIARRVNRGAIPITMGVPPAPSTCEAPRMSSLPHDTPLDAPTRVLIVEDDPALRAAMGRAVSADAELTLVADVGDWEGAERCIAASGHDVVLLDLDLRGRSALDLIPRAVRHARVLVITVLGDEASVLRAIESGASGYLLKDELLDDLTSSIHQVMQGEAPISAAVARHLLRQVQRRAIEPALEPTLEPDHALTPREHQVLTAFARGASYKEVAAECDISLHTVRDYVKTLYRKLGVHSRGEAVTKALRERLVDL
jgi:DNA-binding NarL/FixJ family response regulator